MENVRITSTPYNDVFHTLLNDCSPLLIPVINEVFGEHYSGQEKITFSPNKHFLNQQGGNEEERITDTSFKIEGKETIKYHLECQSSTDNSMLVRFFEYDTQIALDEGQIKNKLEELLNQGVISEYTRCTIIDMSNFGIVPSTDIYMEKVAGFPGHHKNTKKLHTLLDKPWTIGINTDSSFSFSTAIFTSSLNSLSHITSPCQFYS